MITIVYAQTGAGVTLTDCDSFDIMQTLECGQCFRFKKLGEYDYMIVAHNKALRVTQRGNEIFFSPCDTEEFAHIWAYYFDLHTDYAAIKAALAANDDIMREAADYGGGIRLLNQDKWEALISFIISQQKQIPMIQQTVERLCAAYGQSIGDGLYAFPGPDLLADASVEDFLRLKTGYRAAYLYDAVRCVINKTFDPDAIGGYDTAYIRAQLMRVKGVGPKVANCVLLFAYGRREAFPVDVWIARAVRHFYFNGEPADADELQRFAEEKFGPYGGYAQQYLFYYARNFLKTSVN